MLLVQQEVSLPRPLLFPALNSIEAIVMMFNNFWEGCGRADSVEAISCSLGGQPCNGRRRCAAPFRHLTPAEPVIDTNSELAIVLKDSLSDAVVCEWTTSGRACL